MSNLDHLNSWHSDWSEVKAAVFGLGVSGFSVADTLNELGASVLVIADRADEKALEILDVLGIEALIGKDVETVSKRFAEYGADVLITSPGIKPDNELIVQANNSGVAIWTDIDLAWRVRDKFGKASQWICITGTNGKTTVTQLAEQMLLSAGIRAVACGNIGKPILDAVRDPAEFEVLVVELSSFQLHYVNHIEPLASVVLNLADDHLDWHGSMEEYGNTKAKIYNNTKVCCVYNSGDKQTSELLARSTNTDEAQAVGFTVNTPAPNEVGGVEDILVDRAFVDDASEALELASMEDLNAKIIVSPHLMANIAAAASLARAAGVQPEEISRALQAFERGHHRIELVLRRDGIEWVDDSKATNPHAAAAALSSFDSVVWVVGGLLKGVDISELVSKYSAKLKAAIVIGLDREPVLEALAKYSPNTLVHEVKAEPSDVMSEVARIAKGIARDGDTVLLAPAAASMDQFKDYAHRGNLFAEAVMKEVQG
jgi:UDP-N-acetylmuramoylalanine--D-glutamate ligase